jgi:hypothetical protein
MYLTTANNSKVISEISSDSNSTIMTDLSKIDFCIINIGYPEGANLTIFFCHHGANEVSEEIWHSIGYPDIKGFIEALGFREIDFGVFESRSTISNYEGLLETMLNVGFCYSKDLEGNMLNQLNQLIDDVLEIQEPTSDSDESI